MSLREPNGGGFVADVISANLTAVDRLAGDLGQVLSDLRSLGSVFDGFDDAHILHIARECTALLAAPEGLDITLEVIRERIPARLADTAYALAVEIAALLLLTRLAK